MAAKSEDSPKKMADLLNSFKRKKQAFGLVREKIRCGGSDIKKDFIDSIKILTVFPALNCRDFNRLDMHKDHLSTRHPKEPYTLVKWQLTSGKSDPVTGPEGD